MINTLLWCILKEFEKLCVVLNVRISTFSGLILMLTVQYKQVPNANPTYHVGLTIVAKMLGGHMYQKRIWKKVYGLWGYL